MRNIKLDDLNSVSGGTCPFAGAFGGGATVVVITPGGEPCGGPGFIPPMPPCPPTFCPPPPPPPICPPPCGPECYPPMP